VLCADDPVAGGLSTGDLEKITYGYADNADWRVLDWRPAGATRSAFCLRAPDGSQQEFEIGLLGRHNAANAAAVVAVCNRFGVPPSAVAAGLATFRGTRRRFEIIGHADGVTVVDDYAHHPTAIRATLEAARLHYRSVIWAIFQPHTAHRTISLFDDFQRCFDAADHVFLAPTYRPPGRESDEKDPTVAALAKSMHHPDTRALSGDQAAKAVVSSARPGDLVLVMGAGDIWTIEQNILDGLSGRPAAWV
jgi:UDP-N-acetylmuramate--alanine ligase